MPYLGFRNRSFRLVSGLLGVSFVGSHPQDALG